MTPNANYKVIFEGWQSRIVPTADDADGVAVFRQFTKARAKCISYMANIKSKYTKALAEMHNLKVDEL